MEPAVNLRRTLWPATLSALVCALCSLPATAGGLMLYEAGTADVGLASAGYGARAQDASTVLTNPAGMVKLDGSQFLAGAQALYGDAHLSFTTTANTASGGDGGNPIGWAPGASAFYTHQISPDLSIGIGLAGTFGLSEKYDDGWAGRYYIKEATLIGISVLPSIAYRVNDKLSLGLSLNAMYGMLEDKVAVNNLNPTLADGQLKVSDNVWGLGVNLGMLYEFSQDTRVGVAYTSEVKLGFKPNADFSGIGPALSTVLNARGLSGARVNLDMYVPQTVMASLYTQMSPHWAVLAGAGWQQWSRFGKVDVSVESSNPLSLTTDTGFKDTWHGALGAQYRQDANWLYNFGVAYDSAYQDSGRMTPSLPGNAAWRLGAGLERQVPSGLGWGAAAEVALSSNQNINKVSSLPVAAGGRGDIDGSFRNTQLYFLVAYLNWKF
jgi:long-chain fatty acid transport protein